MDTLTELYNQVIVPKDAELEKQAAEMWKQAEEEDAAGRIMARGFADELSKIAGRYETTADGMHHPFGEGNNFFGKPIKPRSDINKDKVPATPRLGGGAVDSKEPPKLTGASNYGDYRKEYGHLEERARKPKPFKVPKQ